MKPSTPSVTPSPPSGRGSSGGSWKTPEPADVGLDRERSWIVLTELNRFIWPGPDIRLAPGQVSPIYDAIPDWLFFDVRDAIVRHSGTGRLEITKRTE